MCKFNEAVLPLNFQLILIQTDWTVSSSGPLTIQQGLSFQPSLGELPIGQMLSVKLDLQPILMRGIVCGET